VIINFYNELIASQVFIGRPEIVLIKDDSIQINRRASAMAYRKILWVQIASAILNDMASLATDIDGYADMPCLLQVKHCYAVV